MKFTKMHGIGNDYIYINCLSEQISNPSELSVRLSDRHYGIGGDGIILICPSDIADFRMDMYNADGSRGKMCGNGIRCFAKYVHDRGLTDKTTITVETLGGIKTISLSGDSIRVDMGAPEFSAPKIPVVAGKDEVISMPFETDGFACSITCVSMGNPHCVVFTDIPVETIELEKIGPGFERNSIFPEQVNTEFVNILGDGSLRMRVWERGSGETWACGTGACAVVAAAVRTGVINQSSAVVHLRGGDLFIEWPGEGSVFMTGSANFVFDGEIDI